jgi:hypothetical protein
MNANDVTENVLVIDQLPRDLPAYGPGSLSECRGHRMMGQTVMQSSSRGN